MVLVRFASIVTDLLNLTTSIEMKPSLTEVEEAVRAEVAETGSLRVTAEQIQKRLTRRFRARQHKLSVRAHLRFLYENHHGEYIVGNQE